MLALGNRYATMIAPARHCAQRIAPFAIDVHNDTAHDQN